MSRFRNTPINYVKAPQVFRAEGDNGHQKEHGSRQVAVYSMENRSSGTVPNLRHTPGSNRRQQEGNDDCFSHKKRLG